MHRIVATLVFALPFAALAQTPTPPPPQPTPPPGWVTPDESPAPEATPAPVATPDSELRATDTLPPEMLRRPPHSPFGEPAVSPTLAFALGVRSVKNRPDASTPSVDFWVGARFHPFVAKAAPFMAAGTEINIRTAPTPVNAPLPAESTSYTEFVPEMRWGFAHLREPHGDYVNTVFPNVELYGITGWRIKNRIDGNALRLGFGISSPALMILSAACEAPIPAMFEVTMDVDSMYSGEREYAFRFGWHF